MPQFNTEAEILKYAQSLINKSQRSQKSNVRKTVGDTVSRNVESEVYAKYSPQEYERRGKNGGLADERNVEVVSVQSSGNTTQVLLENLTEGVDSLKGIPISDTIENTVPSSWYNPDGEWVNGRPFIDKSASELDSGSELRTALIKDLKLQNLDVI